MHILHRKFVNIALGNATIRIRNNAGGKITFQPASYPIE